MTATREEIVRPVVTKVRSNGLVDPRLASDEALKVLNKEPIKTVWGQTLGLPVYDRLPGIEQAYKIEAGPDSAYVYIGSFQTVEGPGSLQPGRDEKNGSIFVMQDGTITWSYGQVEVLKLAADISTLGEDGAGLLDGDYKAGYLMSYDVPAVPAQSFAYQEDALLSEAYIAYASGRDIAYHEDYRALSEDPEQSWWSYEETQAGTYSDGSWYVLDFKEAVWPERIQFVSQPGTRATAKLAVYWSDDAIIWEKAGQVDPTDGSWTFQNSATTGTKYRYWRFFWWDGQVTVGNILYTGEALYEDARKNAPISGAEPFIDDLYEEIDQVHLLVATFTVKNRQIVTITDQRRFIRRKYEPVAQWLTSFPDTMLRCYFEDVENYAALYMAPPTADYHFYNELDTNLCSGAGFITVGEFPQEPLIDFPAIVEIAYTYEVNPGIEVPPYSELYAGQTEDLVAIDPPPYDVGTDGFFKIRGPGLINPIMIEELLAPVLDSDAANKKWTDDTLNAGFDIDNGIY